MGPNIEYLTSSIVFASPGAPCYPYALISACGMFSIPTSVFQPNSVFLLAQSGILVHVSVTYEVTASAFPFSSWQLLGRGLAYDDGASVVRPVMLFESAYVAGRVRRTRCTVDQPVLQDHTREGGVQRDQLVRDAGPAARSIKDLPNPASTMRPLFRYIHKTGRFAAAYGDMELKEEAARDGDK